MVRIGAARLEVLGDYSRNVASEYFHNCHFHVYDLKEVSQYKFNWRSKLQRVACRTVRLEVISKYILRHRCHCSTVILILLLFLFLLFFIFYIKSSFIDIILSLRMANYTSDFSLTWVTASRGENIQMTYFMNAGYILMFFFKT